MIFALARDRQLPPIGTLFIYPPAVKDREVQGLFWRILARVESQMLFAIAGEHCLNEPLSGTSTRARDIVAIDQLILDARTLVIKVIAQI